jgi:hypothetical protein
VILDGPDTGTDLDLYVRKGARASESLWDCRPFANGSDEQCTVRNTGATTISTYIGIHTYSGAAAAPFNLKATVIN